MSGQWFIDNAALPYFILSYKECAKAFNRCSTQGVHNLCDHDGHLILNCKKTSYQIFRQKSQFTGHPGT